MRTIHLVRHGTFFITRQSFCVPLAVQELSVEQADLELTEISWPSKCLDYKPAALCWASGPL